MEIEEESGSPSSWRKVGTYRYRAALSSAYIFSFIGLAFGVVVVGISLPSMAIRYGHTHATDLSAALIGHSVGGITGTVLMGNVLERYGHKCHEIMVLISRLLRINHCIITHLLSLELTRTNQNSLELAQHVNSNDTPIAHPPFLCRTCSRQ